MSPSTVRKLLPGLAVSGVLVLSFLLPASGQILGSLLSYGYGQTIRNGCCVIGVGAPMGPTPGEDIFARGNDNGVWQQHWNGSTFSSFVFLGGLTPDPPGAAWGSAATSVFVNGMDGQLWENRNTGSGFTGWVPKGGGLSAGPGVDLRATSPTHSVDIFINGLDHALWYRTSADDGATLGPWVDLGGGLHGSPGAAAWNGSRIDVFINGLDGQLWHTWSNDGGATWASFQPLGGILTSGPAVTSCAPNHLDIVVLGADHHTYYHMGWTGTGYTGWSAVPGQYNSPPAAVCSTTSAGTIDIFGEGLDNYLWTVSEPAS